MGNNLKTLALLTGMTLLLMFAGDAIGRYLGTQHGMAIGLAVAALGNFISYFFSDKIALAMYGAQPVTREDLPRVYNVVERMTQRVGLPMPKIYVIPNESPNAFATGRNPSHASVAVTKGILTLLDDEELEGVLAHELGHALKMNHISESDGTTCVPNLANNDSDFSDHNQLMWWNYEEPKKRQSHIGIQQLWQMNGNLATNCAVN